MKQNKISVEISYKTIVFSVLFILGLYALFLVKDVILMLFIALLLTAAFNPVVSKLQKKNIPRPLAIALVYLAFYGAIIAAISAILPSLIGQSMILIRQIDLPENLFQGWTLAEINLEKLSIIANQFSSIPKLLSFISSTFSSVVVIFTMTVISFYLLMEREHLHTYLVWFFGDKKSEKRAEKFVDRIEQQVGGWMTGQALLMIVVGVLTYIGLLILGIPFALPLAILAGLLEILPNIGPTIAAIPAIIIAGITISPAMALAVLALYIIIQQLENNFIVPYAMRKAVNINPIVTIIMILVGFRLAGVIGAALAIPVFIVAKIAVTEWYTAKHG